MQEMWVQSPDQQDPLEKKMTTHSSILAWKIPWTEEAGRLQSMGSQKSWAWLSDYTTSNVLSGSKNPNPFLSCLMVPPRYEADAQGLGDWTGSRWCWGVSPPEGDGPSTDTALFQFHSLAFWSPWTTSVLAPPPAPSSSPGPVGGAPWLSKRQDNWRGSRWLAKDHGAPGSFDQSGSP